MKTHGTGAGSRTSRERRVGWPGWALRARGAGWAMGLTAVAAGALGSAGCASLGGPPPALRGTVVDSATGRPLPEVLVRFDDGTEVWADARGEYAVRALSPGRYRVLVVDYGCRTAEGEVMLEAGDPDPVEIRVALPAPAPLTGQVEPPDESRGRVLTEAEIAEMGVARTSEAVRRVAPEMIGAATGDPGRPPALRGRGSPSPSGDRVPVLVVDGIVVHAVDASALDEIVVGDIAWIEILPGAVAGWEYGTGGAGGVIRVQTKRGYRPSRDLSPEYCELPAEWRPGLG